MSTRTRTRLVATTLAVGLAVGLAACGGDDSDGDGDQAPVMTNEFGVETFEPGDDSFDRPETLEPNR